MRKSKLKSAYHWTIMTMVMGMPLALTLLSSIPNAFNDNNVIEVTETKNVNIGEYSPSYGVDVTIDIAKCLSSGVYITSSSATLSLFEVYFVEGLTYSEVGSSTGVRSTFILRSNGSLDFNDPLKTENYYKGVTSGIVKGYLNNVTSLELYPIFGEGVTFEKTITSKVVNNLAYQTWTYMDEFVNLPMNSWYKSLLNSTVGVPTEYTPINNVVIFPLYAIWVLIFDLAFDCLAMIPKLAHHWMEKLEGEEE